MYSIGPNALADLHVRLHFHGCSTSRQPTRFSFRPSLTTLSIWQCGVGSHESRRGTVFGLLGKVVGGTSKSLLLLDVDILKSTKFYGAVLNTFFKPSVESCVISSETRYQGEDPFGFLVEPSESVEWQGVRKAGVSEVRIFLRGLFIFGCRCGPVQSSGGRKLLYSYSRSAL